MNQMDFNFESRKPRHHKQWALDKLAARGLGALVLVLLWVFFVKLTDTILDM